MNQFSQFKDMSLFEAIMKHFIFVKMPHKMHADVDAPNQFKCCSIGGVLIFVSIVNEWWNINVILFLVSSVNWYLPVRKMNSEHTPRVSICSHRCIHIAFSLSLCWCNLHTMHWNSTVCLLVSSANICLSTKIYYFQFVSSVDEIKCLNRLNVFVREILFPHFIKYRALMVSLDTNLLIFLCFRTSTHPFNSELFPFTNF